MSPGFLLDTGPLLAALLPGDRWHGWARSRLEALRGPFGTCEAVLTEAMHLLARRGDAPDRLLQLFDEGAGIILPLGKEIGSVRALCRRYRSVPMDFADGCLVRLSELHPRLPLLTLDSDFLVYRRNRTQRLPLLMP